MFLLVLLLLPLVTAKMIRQPSGNPQDSDGPEVLVPLIPSTTQQPLCADRFPSSGQPSQRNTLPAGILAWSLTYGRELKTELREAVSSQLNMIHHPAQWAKAMVETICVRKMSDLVKKCSGFTGRAVLPRPQRRLCFPECRPHCTRSCLSSRDSK